MDCPHEEFASSVDVWRQEEYEGGPIAAYCAEVHIKCARCGEAFVFLGLPCGSSPDQPMASFLADEARLPIRPSSQVHGDTIADLKRSLLPKRAGGASS